MIGAIAGLGIINTAYLTITKLGNTTTVCPTGGCERVLESPYATVFGQPLALFGLLAYIGMAVLAVGPLFVNLEGSKSLRTNLEKWTWPLLLIGATAMTVFSGYLMYIMTSQFVAQFGVEGICYYCIASALFALSMFMLTLIGRDWDDIGQLLMIGIITLMVTLIATLAVYAPITATSPAGDAKGEIRSANGQLWYTVKNTSGDAEIELARHLKKIGAKMYGAFWCSHCYEQKELFGAQALSEIPYIECVQEGKNPQTQLCTAIATKVQEQTKENFGFPTWEINGKYYIGFQKLTDLAKFSGYQGPLNFKNGV
jgi:uncharacterized membrane protein